MQAESAREESLVVMKPKVKGFICVTSHPEGCAAHVRQQIEYVKGQGKVEGGPKRVLVVGSSTGYGLASIITSAFGSGAATVGVFFERPAGNGKPASAGWYNVVAFQEAAKAAGVYTKGINGDAFSKGVKQKVVEILKNEVGPVDLVVYSLASPRRTDGETGQVYKSVLKPIGQSFTNKTLDTDKKLVTEVSIEPASEQEIAETVKVMGGEDWEEWMELLAKEGLLAKDVKTVAYSYIGPEVTWPVYKNGTIGRAKEDLERACRDITKKLSGLNGKAYVSVNKALVTQASSAIPVVPLYISLLFKVMKERGTHEGCIEQIYRLFKDNLYVQSPKNLDGEGRIRVDNKEMDPEVQGLIKKMWSEVTTENLDKLGDFEGYQKDFLRLFGFEFAGVDYDKPTNLDRSSEGILSEPAV